MRLRFLAEMLDTSNTLVRNEVLGCLEKLGPDAIKATPALLKLLKKSDPATRFRIATILWKIEKHPAAVTACAELLKTDPRITYEDLKQARSGLSVAASYDPSSPSAGDSLTYQVTNFLGEIGPDAKEALPQLREAAAVGVACWFGTCNCAPFVTYFNDKRTLPQYIRQHRRHYIPATVERSREIFLGEAALQAITKIETKPEK